MTFNRLHGGVSRRLALAGITTIAAAATLFSASVLAQAYPSRPIKLVVPFPAGGGTDIIAREVANKVATQQGWTIVIDNKPGSGGNLGVDAAAKSAPDGYTLVLGQTSNLAINPTLYTKLPYNPEKDLAPDRPGRERAAGARGRGRLALQDAGRRGGRRQGQAGAHQLRELRQRHRGAPGDRAVPEDRRRASSRTCRTRARRRASTDLIGGQIQMYMSSIPTLIGHIRTARCARSPSPRPSASTTCPTCRRSRSPATRASRR